MARTCTRIRVSRGCSACSTATEQTRLPKRLRVHYLIKERGRPPAALAGGPWRAAHDDSLKFRANSGCDFGRLGAGWAVAVAVARAMGTRARAMVIGHERCYTSTDESKALSNLFTCAFEVPFQREDVFKEVCRPRRVMGLLPHAAAFAHCVTRACSSANAALRSESILEVGTGRSRQPSLGWTRARSTSTKLAASGRCAAREEVARARAKERACESARL